MEYSEALIWIVGLLVASLVLGIGEVLTPFFGPAIGAFVCLIAANVMAFRQDETTGWVVLSVTLTGVPAFFAAWVKWLPRTSIGRSLMPPPPPAGIGDAHPHIEFLRELVGRTGRAVTPLRPVGSCEFDGRRVDCQAEGGMIDAGREVRVIEVQGIRVVVRAV